MTACFCCGKKVESAVKGEEEKDVWDHPLYASTFEGGHTFGSSVYDSLVNGTGVAILICDKCLMKNKDRILEFRKDK